MSNLSTDCPNTTNITSINGFQAMLACEIILAIFGLLPNALMMMIVGNARVFHSNLRLLLCHLNLILFAYSAAMLVKSMTVLITMTLGDVCNLAMKLSDCKLSEFPVAFPNNALTYASFAICLERVYCTIRYKNYDKNGAKPWAAACLIILIWSIVITNQLVNWTNTSAEKVTPICENLLSVTPTATTGTLAPQMTMEIAIVLISLGVQLWNKHQLNNVFVNASKMTLSARFQLDQNVKLNRLVTPCMIFEAVCYVPIMLLLILINMRYEIDLNTKVFLTHFSYLWKLTFSFLQPIFGFRENPQLNQRLRAFLARILPRCFDKKGQISPENDARFAERAEEVARTYFRNLEQQWAVVPVQPVVGAGKKKLCFVN